MADSWFPTAVISHFYSAVYLRRIPQGDAEALREGGGGDGQSLPAPRRNSSRGCCGKNKNIRIIYLPKGSPYLRAVEECWHQGKRILLVSEYYRTFADMCNAIITYYRTVRFKLAIVRYASRNPKLFCKNL